jgi:hypothetical protein
MSNTRKWFHYAIAFGAVANIVAMALPFIFAPQWYLDYFGLPGGGASILWMRQAGLLLMFISLLYLPGGRDPFRYTMNAYFAVIVRMSIGLYWFWLVFAEGRTRNFLKFGIGDCVFALINAIQLWMVMKERPVDK